ncbi:MAG: Holliday junction resolvase RuvX [Candidatus Gracilibacteria bacterium]|jgi:putative Holliday junction resolvase|nr:Holliday junction resolvase RuvX [Candidatus Gracilibacteria bacterium]
MSSGRVLGIDYGNKNVGVALANLDTLIATPFCVLNNRGKSELFFEIKKLIDYWEVSLIVFGLPINMKKDQKANEIYDELMDFVSYMKGKCDIKIEFFDERLTTFEAKDLLSKQNFSYKAIKSNKDSVSASIILEKWLNSRIE